MQKVLKSIGLLTVVLAVPVFALIASSDLVGSAAAKSYGNRNNFQHYKFNNHKSGWNNYGGKWNSHGKNWNNHGRYGNNYGHKNSYGCKGNCRGGNHWR